MTLLVLPTIALVVCGIALAQRLQSSEQLALQPVSVEEWERPGQRHRD